MKDRLKDFVQAHRDEFDTFTPRPDLWQDIAAELQQEEVKPTMAVEPEREARVISINWHHAWRYAAAVAMLIMVAFSAYYYMNNGAQPSGTVAATQPVPLEKIAPEVPQLETRFASVIEQKEAQLREYDLKALGMDKEWEREAATLDSAYTELKKELYTTPNKDVVVEAMRDNLKMRIAILNRQLQVLENIQQVKKQVPNETTSI
ncbi:anti-sigma factor [Rufibacter psychrotolerans]|uniref:anti-sigma factor n=1 Tax=Rufibacter psychrotolerans TaxID=2812556 RepID=UPI001967E1F1|nr:anti-sigma factor [Rufibacter sp. SYSU D00308]